MIQVESEIEKLLHKALLTANLRIIGIDGELGVGKSVLANQLSASFKLPVISMDQYCSSGTGQYVEGLNLVALRKAIEMFPTPVIVEGVCLLKVLERIRLNADIHFFLFSEPGISYTSNSKVVTEVNDYISEYEPRNKTNWVFNMNQQTNSLDVDIAYLKMKTIVAVVLAFGGITALIVGAIVLTLGVNAANSAVFEIGGFKVTAEGIGAVILGSSVFWAYFAYLSRPVYARRREIISKQLADGSAHSEERETSTMVTVDKN
ncbi:hypothetical protein QZJ86_12805 [Methylomonas montana]|uniref:hypothetical protein n=1 Tax=Methylomonas montana TaxID=3058963 RepID=UPI002658B7E2|nr:hypothetical protein [Methylomonas montana]WKJ88901.1 hypothetical protein QZJ86_12805 [Methylomonas montana]